MCLSTSSASTTPRASGTCSGAALAASSSLTYSLFPLSSGTSSAITTVVSASAILTLTDGFVKNIKEERYESQRS